MQSISGSFLKQTFSEILATNRKWNITVLEVPIEITHVILVYMFNVVLCQVNDTFALSKV